MELKQSMNDPFRITYPGSLRNRFIHGARLHRVRHRLVADRLPQDLQNHRWNHTKANGKLTARSR